MNECVCETTETKINVTGGRERWFEPEDREQFQTREAGWGLLTGLHSAASGREEMSLMQVH